MSQMLRRYSGAFENNKLMTVGYSAEAQQYFDRLPDTPTTTRMNLLATLIDTLVANSAWTPIDILKIYAADTDDNSFINLRKSAHTTNIVNTMTFTADRGWTGGGSGSDELDEQYIPSGGGNAITTTSITLGVWYLTSHNNSVGIGSDTAQFNIYPNYSGDAYFRINDVSAAGSAGSSDGIGFFLGTRPNGTTTRAFKNKVEMSASPITSTTTSLIGAALKSGNGATGQVAASICGADLTSKQAIIYDALYAYLHAVGAV